MDILRLADGRIVEHRDVVQDLALPESTAGANPMVCIGGRGGASGHADPKRGSA